MLQDREGYNSSCLEDDAEEQSEQFKNILFHREAMGNHEKTGASEAKVRQDSEQSNEK